MVSHGQDHAHDLNNDNQMAVVEIDEILKEVAQVSKQLNTDGPNLGEAYRKAVEMYDEVRTHSDSSYFPTRLFREKAPNESLAEFEYRKGIYRSATYYAWARITGVLSRVLNEQNFTVTIPEPSSALTGRDENIEDYLFYLYPNEESILDYFKTVVFPASLEDPNAVMVVQPKTWETIDDESAFIDAISVVYECWRVLRFMEGEYCLIMLGEESEVRSKSRNGYGKKALRRYMFVDTEKYVFIKEVKDANGKVKVVIEENEQGARIYLHSRDILPARRLKGKPIRVGNETIYESYLYPIVPTLDRATCDQSTLDISKYTHAFPQRWEYTTACDADGCHGGYMDERNSEGHMIGKLRCRSCGGTGRKSMIGPMQSYIIDLPEREGDVKPQLPPAGYIDLDHSILIFLDQQIQSNIEKAFTMLNIEPSNSDVKGGAPALSKQIDREELFAFLVQISTTTFNAFEWAVNMTLDLRYGDLQENGIKVSRPQTFDIRNSSVIQEEIKNGDQAVKRWLYKDYAAQRFGPTSRQMEVVELQVSIDDLYGMGVMEVQGLVGSGIMPKWKAVLHFEFTSILDDVVEATPNLMELPLSEIKELMRAEAESRAPQGMAANQLRIEDIIGAANA